VQVASAARCQAARAWAVLSSVLRSYSGMRTRGIRPRRAGLEGVGHRVAQGDHGLPRALAGLLLVEGALGAEGRVGGGQQREGLLQALGAD
jgi:hypothetical protein